MRQNAANYLLVAAAALASIFTLCFGIYQYQREHAFRVDILDSQLQINNYRYHETGVTADSIRMTIIDTLGNVVFDTEQRNLKNMGNHLEREEIQKALKEGSGYAIKRASQTNGKKYFYSATRFDALIVRSSVPYSAELTSSLVHDYTFFYYTAGILLLIAVAIYFRSRFVNSELEKQRIKRQLTENAAHELKTPTATIEGYLDTLVSNPDMPEEKQKEFIQRCHVQSRRMSSLLADMSTLTRLDGAPITKSMEQLDLAQILRQIETENDALFREKGMRLKVEIPNSLPMRGGASLLDSMFRNLFSNALLHATGATFFEVTVKATRERYVFHFADNGVGVPQDQMPHIFERFYRIDKGRSRRLGGTGLGLAIVKNVAVQHGGRVVASQTPGGGLTIEVVLSVGKKNMTRSDRKLVRKIND